VKFGLIHQTALPDGKADAVAIADALEQIVDADALGYDGAWLTEHHFSPYGMGSASTILSSAAAKTRRIRLGASVWVTPIHHPVRLAEDVATLDVLSDGRVNFGVGRGYGPLELSGFGVAPAEAKARHEEAVDVVLKAWTEPVLSHDGQFWQIPPIEVHPKPVQKPHPPVFQPLISPGSVEDAVAKDRNAIFGVRFLPLELTANLMDAWRTALAAAGKRLSAVVNVSVYVAESDAEARRHIEGPAMWLKRQFAELLPDDVRGNRVRDQLLAMDFEQTYATCVAGDVRQVTDRVRWLREQAGVDYLLCSMHFGALPQERILRSMELFAREVMPSFR
jgi:alkanesulfonate monooxygenase SsuD/methylene tetrahydromethanopterin reductase-like flavin-dependent oxidoreductase (luciferase family)